MAYSYAESTASGSTAVFTVPFEYIEKSYVHVSVNGVLVDDALLTWNSSTEVVLPTIPAAGATVRRYRTTPKTPLVTFQSGDLSTVDLNLFAKQCSHLVQEATDTGDSVEAALLAVSNAVTLSQAAILAANTAADLANAAAEVALDPTSYFLKSAFKADGSDDAPVKYGPSGELLTKRLTIDGVVAGQQRLEFQVAGVPKWTLLRDGGDAFKLFNEMLGAAALTFDKSTNRADFAQTPLIAGVSLAAMLGGLKTARLITTSGNIQPSAGTTKWLGLLVGGGSAGVSSGGSGADGLYIGDGGAGGAGCMFFATVSDATGYPAVIGGVGGNSSLTIGSTTYTAGGNGGAATNGLLNLSGVPGGRRAGFYQGGVGGHGEGGHGGDGPFGLGVGGGFGVGSTTFLGNGGSAGQAGIGYGAGGGGGAAVNGGPLAGGAGTPGCLLLLEF